jgi:hypothetical protein
MDASSSSRVTGTCSPEPCLEEEDVSRQKSEPAAKRRRSSILSVIRRQSKSTAAFGISFEDQIAAIDPSLPAEERLVKLFRLCSSAAVRAVQQESGDDSVEEGKIYDFIQDLAGTMRKDDGSGNEESKQRMAELGRRVGQLNSVSEGGSAEAAANLMLPPRVRQIRDYTAKLEVENDAWKAMMAERKENYKRARAEKLLVLKGESKLMEASDACHMPEEVRIMLQKLPDGRGAMETLIQMEKMLDEKEKSVANSIKASMQNLDAGRKRNADAVAKIRDISDHLNQCDVGGGGGGVVASLETFQKDVDRWMRELNMPTSS